MGYQVPRTVFRLAFADKEHDGLVVRARAMVMRDHLHAVFDLTATDEDTIQTLQAKQLELYQMFVDHLVDWNLEDEDGQPIPQTLEGLQSLEMGFASAIVRLWRGGVAAADEDETPVDESILARLPVQVAVPQMG